MAKRKKGQTPYVNEHPDRPWLPDVPGHQNHRKGVVVNKETKELLIKQVKELSMEIVEKANSVEHGG